MAAAKTVKSLADDSPSSPMALMYGILYRLKLTVTITTVTCSAPHTVRPMAHSKVLSVPGVSSIKQKTRTQSSLIYKTSEILHANYLFNL